MEDESNQNTDFDRNFIRSKVLPILNNRFSHIIKVISRSSTHLAEAQNLLDDLAKIDLKNHLKSNKYKHKLQVNALNKLSFSRAKNVLRYWLEFNDQLMPSKDLLDELLRQVLTAKKDADLKIQLTKNHEIRRYQNTIYIVPKNQKYSKNDEMIWTGQSKIILPNGHQLTFKKVKGRGINFKLLQDQKLKIKNRQGGEFFKPDPKRPTKKIKQLLQESDLPPWERENLPLIFVGDQLAFIPHFGIDVKYQVKSQEMGLEIKFIPSK
jgi:tRNA(Ile)-lysidine synthase